mgnify:CR=1 FL=1
MQLQTDSTQIVLIVLAGVLIVSVVSVFYRVKKKTTQRHHQKMLGYQNAIMANEYDIQNRQQRLQHYDFLKYNLAEALVPQLHIEI